MLLVEKGPPVAALGELKAYLRVEDVAEDALLAGLLRAASETVEAMLGVLLFERGVEEHGVLASDGMRLTAEPVRSLVSVATIDADGSETILATDQVRMRTSTHGEGFLVVDGIAAGTIVVARYRAGMATDWNWVPDVLRLAVVRAAAHFHAHRDARDDAGLPPAVQRMLAPWRARRIR
jgi:uncharacterized phiE125 gp8 family phage protein